MHNDYTLQMFTIFYQSKNRKQNWSLQCYRRLCVTYFFNRSFVLSSHHQHFHQLKWMKTNLLRKTPHFTHAGWTTIPSTFAVLCCICRGSKFNDMHLLCVCSIQTSFGFFRFISIIIYGTQCVMNVHACVCKWHVKKMCAQHFFNRNSVYLFPSNPITLHRSSWSSSNIIERKTRINRQNDGK